MEKILYFDICALVILLTILAIMLVRRTVSVRSNRMLYLLLVLLILTTCFDLGMEKLSAAAPLGKYAFRLFQFCTYNYFLLRTSHNLLYVLFILAVSGNWKLLGGRIMRLLLLIPYLVIAGLILSNLFNGKLFLTDPIRGYLRGPWMWTIYAASLIYMVIGIAFLVYCAAYLDRLKWLALAVNYFLSVISVLIQLFFPWLLVEMFSMAVSMLILLTLVQRPEEIVDHRSGLLSWSCYEGELHRTLATGDRVQILIARCVNNYRVRASLGEDAYEHRVRTVGREIRRILSEEKAAGSIYFANSGCYYIILEDGKKNPFQLAKRLHLTEQAYLQQGGVDTQMLMKYTSFAVPEDIPDYERIIHYGTSFTGFMKSEVFYMNAREVIGTRSFLLRSNMDEILTRALNEGYFSMYYQPVYSVREGRFTCAEALIRLKDPAYGFISPGFFIPEAEKSQLILEIGDFVLEEVFSFVSRADIRSLGLDYIELNLSVAQCCQANLVDDLQRLRSSFRVDPALINLEVTETSIEESVENITDNLLALHQEGFSFSLDDYGTGYSNMQRIIRYPFRVIKLDKCLIDSMDTEKGTLIVKNTIRMLKDIQMHIVAEGVETREQADLLAGCGCDDIQGFFYARPMPEDQFLAFIREHNRDFVRDSAY